MAAYGLQTHIWNNNLKSILLLIGFPVLLLWLMYGLSVAYVGMTEPIDNLGQGFVLARDYMTRLWPYALTRRLLRPLLGQRVYRVMRHLISIIYWRTFVFRVVLPCHVSTSLRRLRLMLLHRGSQRKAIKSR